MSGGVSVIDHNDDSTDGKNSLLGNQSGVRTRWLALMAILSGAFLTNLDTFVLNVAIARIQKELNASYATMELIIVGYSLAFGTLLITSGRLGDRYGRRRIFLIGLSAFTITSAFCGLSPSGDVLVISRIAQGISAAILLPQVFTLIRVMFPEPREHTLAFAFLGGAFGLSSILGQVLGGILVQSTFYNLGWRLVFLVNLPIGVLAYVAARLLLRESYGSDRDNIDFIGVILSATGLFLFLYPLIQSSESGWTAFLWVMLAISVPTLTGFVIHQISLRSRERTPLIDFSLFHLAPFRSGLAVGLLMYSCLMPLNFFLSVTLQNGIGMSPLEAGLTFLWAATPFTLTSLLTGRVPPNRAAQVLTAGAALILIASLWLLHICWRPEAATADVFMYPLAIMGVGYGLLETPLLNVTISRVPDTQAGMAAGVVTTMRQIGGAIGVAVVGMFFKTGISEGYMAAFGSVVTYQVGAILVAALFLISLYPEKNCARVDQPD